MDISVTHDNFSAKDFNPLPRKEGDVFAILSVFAIVHFNPLPRKEGDSIHTSGCADKWISIRSLVKRETHCNKNRHAETGNFNPLPRKEGDCKPPDSVFGDFLFQSTPS